MNNNKFMSMNAKEFMAVATFMNTVFDDDETYKESFEMHLLEKLDTPDVVRVVNHITELNFNDILLFNLQEVMLVLTFLDDIMTIDSYSELFLLITMSLQVDPYKLKKIARESKFAEYATLTVVDPDIGYENFEETEKNNN
ncbi:TPA: hypothetical protein ACTEJE_002037 [Streptococcus agalactiae]